VHPFMGIASVLERRGHEVVMLANPHFASLIEGAGHRLHPIGSNADYDRLFDDPDLWVPYKSLQVLAEKLFLPSLRELYAALESEYRPGETVVVTTSIGLAERTFQDRFGVPTATCPLSPATLRSFINPPVVPGLPLHARQPRALNRFWFWMADVTTADRLLAPTLNAFRDELGLGPVRSVIGDWAPSPERVIGMFPDWFAPPPPDWPSQTRLAGFPLFDEGVHEDLPDDAMAFLESGDRPVVFMPGSAMRHADRFFAESAAACARLGTRGLLLTRDAHQIPADLPDGVRHFDYLPFSRLLPHARAIVHHGGIGTTAQALRAGLPQIIHPLAHDQQDNAARLQRLGVGLPLPGRRYRAKRLAARLQHLLEDDGVAVRTREISERLAQERGAEVAADLIEALFRSHR
jgi:rhamnosyltransferase subunit B